MYETLLILKSPVGMNIHIRTPVASCRTKLCLADAGKEEMNWIMRRRQLYSTAWCLAGEKSLRGFKKMTQFRNHFIFPVFLASVNHKSPKPCCRRLQTVFWAVKYVRRKPGDQLYPSLYRDPRLISIYSDTHSWIQRKKCVLQKKMSLILFFYTKHV